MFPFGKKGREKDSAGDPGDPKKNKKLTKAKISNPLSKEEIQRLEQTKNKLFGSFSSTPKNKPQVASRYLPRHDSSDDSEAGLNAKPKLPPRPNLKQLAPLGPPPLIPPGVFNNGSRPDSPSCSDTMSNASDLENMGFGFPVLKSFNLPGLNLPILPEVSLSERDVILKRLPAGDFGFSLRRAPIISKNKDEDGRTIIFAEPNTPSNSVSNQSGLLPGDQLIAVNGKLVESMNRDEIVKLVREADKTITLTVRPVPELSEINGKGDFENGEGEMQLGLEGVVLRGKTKVVNGNSNDCENVWLNHKGGFAAAQIVSSPSAEGKVKIRLANAPDQVFEVDNYDVDKANHSKQDKCEDLTHLLNLNESSILHLLRQRYGSNLIHSYGSVTSTLIISPINPLSIYSDRVIGMFRGKTRFELRPHIYAVAQQAYRTMQSTGKNQSIVFTGYSGSGKTTQAKHCMHYLALTANTVNHTITVDKMSALWNILEAFGNCSTVDNPNASRFATVLTLDFDHMAQISAGMVQGLLLETQRVVNRPARESNFHILWYLWHGANSDIIKQLQLGNMDKPVELLGHAARNATEDNFCIGWKRVIASLETFNISPQEIQVIVCTLGAIFHLSTAKATQGVPSFKANFVNTENAQKAAVLLGIPLEDLHKTIFMSQHHEEQVQKINRQSLGPKRGIERKRINLRMSLDKGHITDRIGDGMDALNAFIVGLYNNMFNAIIALINRCLSSNYRTVTSITLVDCPGFQNINSSKVNSSNSHKVRPGSLSDFCFNYINERLNMFFFNTTFNNQLELFQQQQVEVDFEKPNNSPQSIVEMLDKQSQQELIKSTNIELRSQEKRGLLWLLDEESIFPGATDESFIERIFVHYGDRIDGALRKTRMHNHFVVRHAVGTLPIIYNATGWLRLAQENPVSRAVLPLLQNSHKESVSTVYLSIRAGGLPGVNNESASARRLTTTEMLVEVVKTLNNPQTIKRKSLCAMTKVQMDCIIETVRRVGRTHFVHCCLPTGDEAENSELDVPLLRAQIRGIHVMEAARFSKIGFPERMGFGEFKRTFQCLAPPEFNINQQVVLDDRKGTINLLNSLEIDENFYRLGLSQIFVKSDLLCRLESFRDEKLSGVVVKLQAHCRSFIALKLMHKRKVQDTAIRCLQKNVSKYMKVRTWPWWKLYTRVYPLLDLHRTEEQLKDKADEIDNMRCRFEKLEKSFGDLRLHADRLEARLADSNNELSEERAAAAQSMEALECENTARLRLEKDLCEVKTQFAVMERKAAKLELNKMQLATLDTQLQEEEEEGDVNYKTRCGELRKQLEAVKKQLAVEKKDEMGQQVENRKQVERKLAEVVKECDVARESLENQRRRAQKAVEELQDTKMHLQQVTARNNELERKQNRFDMELKREQDEKNMQKSLKEKFVREKEAAAANVYNMEQQINTLKNEASESTHRVVLLQKNMEELSCTNDSAGMDTNSLMQLRVEKQDLERKCKEQEEELDDMAGTIQQLQASVTRLEMGTERWRQEKIRDGDVKEHELQELRAQTQRRVRILEQKLEDEIEQRKEMLKDKRELEIQLREKEEITVFRDESVETNLRRDLRRTKALLKDAHTLLQHMKDNAPSRGMIKQLKNQLEDAEFGRVSAVKGKQSVETELTEVRNELHAALSAKSAAEDRCLQLMKEKHGLESQIDDQDEQLQQLLKKYKAQVQQSSVDHITLNEQTVLVKDFETNVARLQQQVIELSAKVEWHEAHSVDKHKLILAENLCRELQAKLDLETATRSRFEGQTTKAKDSVESLQTELANLRAARDRENEQQRRLQNQLNQMRDTFDDTQKKETEASMKNADLEAALERGEQEHSATMADLKLALRRIDDLQMALTDDIDLDDIDVTDSEGEETPYTNGHTPESDRFLSTVYGDTNSELAASPIPRSLYTASPQLLGSMSSLSSSKTGEKRITSTPAL